MSLHKAHTIDEFRVRCPSLQDNCKANVDNWLSFAMGKEVKRFEWEIMGWTTECYPVHSPAHLPGTD